MEWFGIIFGLMFFKGILASLAGPAPNYDMQRVLATRNPREACLMNGMVNVVLVFSALHDDHRHHDSCARVLRCRSCGQWKSPTSSAAADRADAVRSAGCCSVCLLAGLLAAFMSNFAATINAAPGLHRQRHLQAVHQSELHAEGDVG